MPRLLSPTSVTKEVLVATFCLIRVHSNTCMSIDALLEPGTRNVTTFRYCTTCKRFLELVRFNFERKTCNACLLKSRDRADLRRRKLESGNAQMFRRQLYETLVKLKAAGKRTCSSCKVAKTPSSFVTKRKTCKTCLNKRRIRRCHHLTGRLRHSNVASWCWNCFIFDHHEHSLWCDMMWRTRDTWNSVEQCWSCQTS